MVTRILAIAAPALVLLTSAPSERHAVEGVWEYRALQRAGAREVPVTGVIAFVNGYFVQQSLNGGEPIHQQLFQAHAGTYHVVGDAVRLISNVGLLIDPSGEPPIESRRDAEHRVRTSRSGDDLTLTFSTGTIQRLRLTPMRAPRVIVLSRGVLLLGGDGRFSLTAERDGSAAAGWGTYHSDGERLRLRAERWLRLAARRPEYKREVEIRATLTKRAVTLSDGLSFAIEPSK